MSYEKPTKEEEAKVQEIIAGHKSKFKDHNGKFDNNEWLKAKGQIEEHVRRNYLSRDTYLDKAIKKEEAKHSVEKSWENVKKLRHQIQKDHKEVTQHLEAFMAAFNRLVKNCDKAYHSAPRTDAPTLNASPISPSQLWILVKTHMHKKGFEDIGYIIDSWKKPEFGDAINEGMRWLLRLEKDDSPFYGSPKERKQRLEEMNNE
jgi:hypothetical protein